MIGSSSNQNLALSPLDTVLNPSNNNEKENNVIEITQFEDGNISKYQQSVYYLSILLDSYAFIAFMAIITIFFIFEYDIEMAISSQQEPSIDILLGIRSFIFFIFIFEIFLSCYCKSDYLKLPNWNAIKISNDTYIRQYIRYISFGSFYFWADTISTISCVFNLFWIIPLPTNTFTSGDYSTMATSQSTTARDQLVIRCYELTLMIRLVKYISYITKPKKYNKFNSATSTTTNTNSNNTNNTTTDATTTSPTSSSATGSESHVGRKMSDLTNKRLIILIIGMLMVIPVLYLTTTDLSFNLSTEFINNLAILNMTDNNIYNNILTNAINDVLLDVNVIRIVFTHNNIDNIYYTTYDYNTLRAADITTYTTHNTTYNFATTITYNNQSHTYNLSLFHIFEALIVIFLLLTWTYLVSNDVNKLVIMPIERMVELVQQISANPLGKRVYTAVYSVYICAYYAYAYKMLIYYKLSYTISLCALYLYYLSEHTCIHTDVYTIIYYILTPTYMLYIGVEYKQLGAADGFREGLETTVLLSTITKIGQYYIVYIYYYIYYAFYIA